MRASRAGRRAARRRAEASDAVPVGTPPTLRRCPRIVLADGAVLHIARTPLRRLRGLLGTRELPAGHALLLAPTSSVHTIGMEYALDLVWLDRAGTVLRVDAHIGARRHRRCRGAKAVVETRAGEGLRYAALMGPGTMAMMNAH